AGLARARSEGRQLGPSVIAEKAECAILAALSKKDGSRLRKITASFGVATITPPRRSMTPRSPASQVCSTTRSVFWQHRATLESGARVPPHCVEALHFRLRAAQAISDCPRSPHQAPLFQYSTLIATHVHAQAAGSVHCP